MLPVGARSCTEPNRTLVGGSNEKLPNQSFNRGDDGAKPKPQHGDLSVDNQGHGVLSRSNHSRTTSRVHFELIGWATTSLFLSSQSKTPSKPSRANPGEASGSEATRSCSSRSERLLLLPWLQEIPDFPMPVPPQVSRRSFPTRISSGIRPYTQSFLWDRKTIGDPIVNYLGGE